MIEGRNAGCTRRKHQPATFMKAGQLQTSATVLGCAAEIKPLIYALDRDHMMKVLDLWNYEDVKASASFLEQHIVP